MSTERHPGDAPGRGHDDRVASLMQPGERWPGRGRVDPEAMEPSVRRSDSRLARPKTAAAPLPGLDAVLAAMADAVLVYDRDGRILKWTGALAAAFGLGADGARALAGLPMAELGRRTLPRTPDGRPLAPDEWPAARILAGEELTGERTVDLLVTAPDGREVCLNAAGGPLRDEVGRVAGAVVVLRDVSERRRLERELAARSAELEVRTAELEAVFEAMADGVLVVDGHGRVTRTNRAWREALRRAADVLGLAADPAFAALPLDEQVRRIIVRDEHGRVLPHEEWPTARELRGEALTGRDAQDEVLLGPDGRELRFSASAAPIRDTAGRISGVVRVVRDVSERRRLERELAARTAELESIFATQAEGVLLADASGRVLRMNDAQRRLLAERGIDPAGRIDDWARQSPPTDATGRPLPPEQWPFYRALRGETLVGARAVEMRRRAADGRDLVVRMSAAPLRDAEGRIVGVVLTTVDVSEQRRLELQRLDIMRVVAHDLGSPISAVQLYVQTQRRRLERGRPPFTPDDGLLGSMEHALGRIWRLLDDLKVASSIETGGLALRRAACDLAELCRREAAAVRIATGRAVRVKAPRGAVRAEADAGRIGQVLANLLSNACKYSPKGRRVAVELTTPGGAAGGAAVARLAVRDEGPGIPEAERGRIFEQFHRVPGVEATDGSTGLGLGLYISRGIVERHGGAMGVESVLGRGSTFWFTLPLAGRSA